MATKTSKSALIKGFEIMCQAKAMTELYEEQMKIVGKYVHATSRGHEAIQIAVGRQLTAVDYAFPYYRDDAMLMAIGLTPYELMLQLMGKRSDPSSGGRSYYSHPSVKRDDIAKVPHQSAATGMQAIPAAGAAMGMLYKEKLKLAKYKKGKAPVVVCSLGDASVTEGEVAEAFQMAALKRLPILFLVQDNEWDISAHASEVRSQNAFEYAQGFVGLEAISIKGNDFALAHQTVKEVLQKIRTERRPYLLHATVPLLNHHTSGVRMEWYRDDLEEDKKEDPYPILVNQLVKAGVTKKKIKSIETETKKEIQRAFEKALAQDDPEPADLLTHDYAATPITEESGTRHDPAKEMTVMVDCALHAVEELMREHPEALLYGQDVGGRLGGVFREAATLAQKFGDERVFNTAIQEAFIIGSTVGMSAVGLKPIVEVQFADYIWPGLNQLYTEVSRSCYLSNGQWPVSMILRVPIGAYGGGGPYHSSSVESIVTNIKGVKIAYPSNGADLKGLIKSAYYDPNPVVIFEHKGLYWSKVPGTEAAKVIEPSEDYRVPFGKGRIVLSANEEDIKSGNSACVITYGMGVHWSLNAAKDFAERLTILDLRTLNPIDYELIESTVRKHGRCLMVTEETIDNCFARSLAGWIQEYCFDALDAPVMTIGAVNMPAIPLNGILEETMMPSAGKVAEGLGRLLGY